MKEIDNFVKIYNEYLKLKEDFYPNVEYIVKVCDDDTKNGIWYFLDCFIFPEKYNEPEFCFESNHDFEDPKFIHFATNYNVNLYYAYDLSNDSISVIDFETEVIVWHCASSVVNFFMCMSIIMEPKSLMYKMQKYDLDKEYLMSRFNECMAINGQNEKYKDFYVHMLNLRDDWVV